MSRRTAGPEAGSARPSVPRTAPSRLARWSLLALGAGYVAASLAGVRLDASIAALAYAPPVAGFAFMAAFFAATLRRTREPLVSRVARREHPHLPPALAAYTRALTALWAAAFAALAAATLALAFALPFPAWSRWTHALALAVPAALFFGEYLWRLHRFPAFSHARPPRLFLNIVQAMKEAATGAGAGTHPLLQIRSPHDAVLLDHDRTVTAAQYLGQVHALAAALPEGVHVVNVCETRHAFLVAFGAALVRGQVSLLPPGNSRGDWERVLAKHPGAPLLGEQCPADIAAPWIDVRPYLATESSSTRVPRIEARRAAAILFTSGSTGESVGHPKTWDQLWRGAATWADALGWQDAQRLAVLASVPPQHMFGLEATVMLPLYAGVPAHAHRPLLPADVDAALQREGRTFWWMTTPIHLRAALASTIAAPHLGGIVSSTMSLAPAAARQAEARWNVPLVEIYGSTETGALATRRTAREEAWTPLPDIALVPDGEAVRAEGGRVGAALRLGDILEFAPDGRFLWRGRSADLVKVAGKRASLSALERRLQEIEGVDDGAFFVPSDGADEVKRLAAFYVSSTVDPDAVVEALRHELDPVFVPRPLFRVARLPRNANGKLPRAALSELYEACHSPERFTIAADHPAIPGHFPGNPVVPGALILARVAQAMAARFPGHRAGPVASARFHARLAPGEAAHVEMRREGARVAFEVKREAELLASGTWRID